MNEPTLRTPLYRRAPTYRGEKREERKIETRYVCGENRTGWYLAWLWKDEPAELEKKIKEFPTWRASDKKRADRVPKPWFEGSGGFYSSLAELAHAEALWDWRDSVLRRFRDTTYSIKTPAELAKELRAALAAMPTHPNECVDCGGPAPKPWIVARKPYCELCGPEAEAADPPWAVRR